MFMYVAVRKFKDGLKGGREGERKSYFVATDAPMFYARISQSRQKKRKRKTYRNFVHIWPRLLTSETKWQAAAQEKNQALNSSIPKPQKTSVLHFFPTKISSHYALLLRATAPPASSPSPCTPLDSLFHAKDPAALRLIGVRGARQWFIMPALLKCQEALPLHACMCARVHSHGEIKVQQEPGDRLEHNGGAAVRIFDVSDQRSRAFLCRGVDKLDACWD